jgi:hypothetical protein
MKRLMILALVLGLAAMVSAEVWNDPSGLSVTDTSQTVTFPRPFTDVLVHNDETTESIYVRLFWCGDTAAAATTASLEIKATKNRSFKFAQDTEWLNRSSPAGYCAIALIGPAAGSNNARLEGK